MCIRDRLHSQQEVWDIRGGRILGSPIEMAGHSYNSAALPRSLWLFMFYLQTYCLYYFYAVIDAAMYLSGRWASRLRRSWGMAPFTFFNVFGIISTERGYILVQLRRNWLSWFENSTCQLSCAARRKME